MDAHREAARHAAYRAFDARVPHVPVADLIFDSLLARPAAPAHGNDPCPLVRHLFFATEVAAVHVAAAINDEPVRLRVGLHPEFPALIEVRGAPQGASITTDETGFAEFDAPQGLASLLVVAVGSGEPRLQTAWVSL